MRGIFSGLGHDTDRSAMTQAVLEGVAFAFRDGKDALEAGSPPIREAMVIGGGARSDRWLSILANTLNLPLKRYHQAEAGAAFGAARLAHLACTGESPEAVCTPPSGEADNFTPHPPRVAAFAERYTVWRRAAEVSRTLR